MNRDGRMMLRLAVGAYLVYLAYDLVTSQLRGGTDMSGLLAYGSAVVMGLGGLGFCGYALAEYRKDKKRDAANAEQAEADQSAGA